MTILSSNLNPNLWWVITTTLGALVAGTMVRLVSLRHQPSERPQRRLGSLRTWWAVAIVTIAAALGGLPVAAAIFAAVSCLAFREFAALIRPQPLDEDVTWAGLLTVAVAYIGLVAGGGWMALIAAPWIGGLIAGGLLAGTDRLSLFVPHASGVVYALMITATLPGVAVLTVIDGAGLFLMLVGLTEINDIAAALVGRQWGRRPMAPMLSPKKTLEGFFGGVIVTVSLALVAGPALTTWSAGQNMLAGLVIALTGTLGDLNLSAVKRCAAVKDSGDLLPGQGGLLDRIDSLTFSAPAFYLLVRVWAP